MTWSIDTFILSLFAHEDKVRASSLFQVLKGKRTLSVISHGFFYDTLAYFGLLTDLTQATFDKIIIRLLKAQLLSEHNEQVKLTQKGKHLLQQLPPIENVQQLNGFLYHRNDDTFHQMLLFATQVISELSYENVHYLPVEGNGFRQMQLKQWLVKMLETRDKQALIRLFQAEWQQLLAQLSPSAAEFLTNQLSGHELAGKTIYQIGDVQGQTKFESFLIQKSVSHQILSLLEKSPTFDLLGTLYQGIKQYPFNQSAQQSYAIFSSNLSLEATMQIRKLRKSTLEEHLLEFAIIEDDFPFSHFLSPEKLLFFETIEKKYPLYRSWQYRLINQHVTAELDFFLMRLYQIKRKKEEVDAN